MIAKQWRTSERRYNIIIERHVSIPMRDGITIDADVFRPDAAGRFPALVGVHPYDNALQTAPIMPVGMSVATGGIEAGDPNFYVRRGYVQIVANVRGTGESGGHYYRYQPDENRDTYEIIEWVAGQPWCDGNVGMFGVSYFAIAAQRVVSLKPPHLKAIFAPFAATDQYRDTVYHGGILAHGFMNAVKKIWSTPKFGPKSWYERRYGEERFRQAIAETLQDRELRAVPYILEALTAGKGALESYLLNLDGEYYREQSVDYSNTEIPAYLGACWGIYGLHLPGAFRSWENWTAPKKLTVGPPIYLDRPVYQYAYESLRWFDYWLKGMDNGIMDEPPVKLFVIGTGEWRYASEWPLPETRWTPFYLHADGLLSEHEFWPNEGASTFEDSPYNRGSLTFLTPPLVENTEVIGPIALNLYASTTDTDVLWFATLLDIDEEGRERLLTRGWLRGSQRRTDPQRSKPWQPYHVHTEREPLTPGEIYEFNIEIRPYSMLFPAGHRIGIRIKCVDDEKPGNALEAHNIGHLWRQTASRVTVFHNSECPSHLLLPITKGNVIGTYMSGGKLPQEMFPYRMW